MGYYRGFEEKRRTLRRLIFSLFPGINLGCAIRSPGNGKLTPEESDRCETGS